MWRHSYVVSAYITTLKVTVQVLASGCQYSYRKFYGFFLQCTVLMRRPCECLGVFCVCV